MTDRPILFSAPMVRALLGGRKTQTRRQIKPQPPEGARYTGVHFASDERNCHFFNTPHGPFKVPVRIEDGDRLWVRERFLPDPPSDDPSWDDNVCTYVEWAGCGSRISDVPPALRASAYSIYAADPMWSENSGMVWRPSIHMPRWASRLTVTVTDVRVERLQDISEADAIAEGIARHKSGWMPYATAFYDGDGITPANYHADPRVSYMQLWDSINGAGAWEANPWVAAYTFTVIPKNIDEA